MRLEPQELRDLAAFCARRFPEPAARARLAHEAGVGPVVEAEGAPVAAWEALLAHARARGRLGVLLERMRAAAPDDRNLAEVAELLVEKRAKGGRGGWWRQWFWGWGSWRGSG